MRRILNIRLPGQPDALSESDHRVYISGLIDFNLECVVRAVGALLHYLDEFGIGVANLVKIFLKLQKVWSFLHAKIDLLFRFAEV
jgi:hypothetical protein